MTRSIMVGPGRLLAALLLGWGAVASAADPVSRDELFGTTPPASPPAAEGKDAAPASKDSLFGTPPPAPPASDALLGAPAQPAFRFSGFLDGLAAYSYDDPTHWSRAVARLQLAAQGEFGPGIRWKLSGRVDGDPVYLNSGFYPDAVKRDQRIDFLYRENYLDFSAGNWDFRLGAQQIVWGEVVGLYFADVVSARDMRDFLLPSFDIMRIPQWAARAEYTAGDGHVEFIYIPVPAFDDIGKPGSDFYPVPLDLPASNNVGEVFHDPQRPSHTLSNANYGVRANTLIDGWDLSAFYYRSFSTSPTFYRDPGGSVSSPYVFDPSYDRIWQAGGTVSQDLGPAVLRGEAVYTHGRSFALSDLTVYPSTVERQTIDYIVSLEWALPHDTRLNVQGFQRIYDGGADGIAFANDGVGASVFISTKLTPTLEPQLLWIRNFHDGGQMVRPRLNWTVAPNLTLGFGVDIFSGPRDTFFGRYTDRDRVYTEARWDF
ncbi:MAG: DUF1302 family protein [Burkholderiales bacterium]